MLTPSSSRVEHRTTAALVERLRSAGLEPRVLPTGTGLVCDVIGSAGEAPSIGFRGDIDALPLDDTTTTSYRSRTAGVCHACGHDAHTTVVLGTALVLAELARDGLLTRSARLIFQPAEEIIPGGALDVVEAGETLGLEHVFAFHCEPRLDVGRVGFRVGAITAGADGIRVTLTGPGGHTARPHLTADLVYALGFLITELPGALSRLTDPRAGLSVVWGQVHAGTAANAIPAGGFVEGTVRCLDADVWRAAHDAGAGARAVADESLRGRGAHRCPHQRAAVRQRPQGDRARAGGCDRRRRRHGHREHRAEPRRRGLLLDRAGRTVGPAPARGARPRSCRGWRSASGEFRHRRVGNLRWGSNILPACPARHRRLGRFGPADCSIVRRGVWPLVYALARCVSQISRHAGGRSRLASCGQDRDSCSSHQSRPGRLWQGRQELVQLEAA